jgi:hypothetical protein
MAGFFRPKQIEFDELITPDGNTYNLNDFKDRFLLIGVSGQGMPPIEWITQRGPFQHGTTVKGYRLGERVLQMVHRRNAEDRYEYWQFRQELIDAVRPNRNTGDDFEPTILRKILPDGSKRDLEVRIEQGPAFDPGNADQWDEYSIQDALRFVAADPTFFDPDTVQLNFSIVISDDFMFPITFPIRLGIYGVIDQTVTVNYEGNWPAYPVIHAFGPIHALRITNQVTGEAVALDYNIPAGKLVTIDLRYGQKIVYDDSVPPVNLTDTLTTDSQSATFRIIEAPRAPAGVNTLRVEANSMNLNSYIDMSYNTRFLAI